MVITMAKQRMAHASRLGQKKVKTMASFALSATTVGTRKLAWTKRAKVQVNLVGKPTKYTVSKYL